MLEHKIKLRNLILDKTGVNIDELANKDHFFQKEFERIFESDNPVQYKDKLIYFHYFLNQFEKIKSHNTRTFKQYLKDLSKDGKTVQGQKFEILTYARLLDNGIKFIKPKKNPDFKLEFQNDSLFIECTIRQPETEVDFFESIRQRIKEKQTKGSKQNYANKNTALHIDISKAVYKSLDEFSKLDTTALNEFIDEAILTVDYGAIVLIDTFYAKEDGIVYSHPKIRYNKKCNPNLEILHNDLFNVQPLTVSRIYKPFI